MVKKGPKATTRPIVRVLPGCVANFATVAKVGSEIRDAIALHLDGLREDDLPEPAAESQVEYVEVPA